MGMPLSGFISENDLANSTRVSSSMYENEQRQQLLLGTPFKVINFFKVLGGIFFTLQRGKLPWPVSHLVLQPLRDW